MQSKESVFDAYVSAGAYKWYVKLAAAEALELKRQELWNDALAYIFGFKFEEWELVQDRARLEQLSDDVRAVVDAIALGKKLPKQGIEVLALLKAYESAINLLRVDNDLMDLLDKIKFCDSIRLAFLDKLDEYLENAAADLRELEGKLAKAKFDLKWSKATLVLNGVMAAVTVLGPEIPLAYGLGAALFQWGLGSVTGSETSTAVTIGGHAASGASVATTIGEHVAKVNELTKARQIVKVGSKSVAIIGVGFDFAEVYEGDATVDELAKAILKAQASLELLHQWHKQKSALVNRIFLQVKAVETKAKGKRAKALKSWNDMSAFAKWREDTITGWSL